MSTANRTNGEPQANDLPSFEASLAELQQIARDLEDGTLGLEESIARFEQGTALLRSCYQILERAEQKIEILTGLAADGTPLTAPFDSTATIARPRPAAGKRTASRSAESAPAVVQPPERPCEDEDEEDDREATLF
jgi:exodeoxyribonuclease VII small subunit